jgi:predicted permease
MRRPFKAFLIAVHRLTLLLHPAEFRDEFGQELEDTFAAMVEEVGRTRGVLGVLHLLFRTIADNLRCAVFHRSQLEGGVSDRSSSNAIPQGGGGLVPLLRSVLRDGIVGMRMLARRPVFAVVAVGTLALGIGANAAIFSVVNGVLIRPLPFPDADRLVRLYHVNTVSGNRQGSFSLPDREDVAELSTSLDHVAVYTALPSGLLLTGGDQATEVRTAYVSAGFFDVLGRDAYLGRVLLDREERGDNRVVVLSHGFWERRFGADEGIVGRSITLDDSGFLVAGVMPPDFSFPTPDVEVWAFLSIIPESSIPLGYRQVRFLDAIGRLAEGTSIAQAESELSAVSRTLASQYPDENEGLLEASLVPLRDSMTAGVEASLLLLLGAVGLVLLIACGNVTNLLLSRSIERTRELEIRQALGAGRGRLVRQLMTESVLLSGIGATVGVALAYWGTSALLNLSGDLLPRSGEIRMDGSVLLFTLVVAVVTAVVFGLAPAMSVTRTSRSGISSTATRSGARRPGAVGRWGLLTGSQVALATVLVITAGLLLRALWSLQLVDPGLDAERLATVSLTINDARYPAREDYGPAYERLLEGFRTLPGVDGVASIRFLPLRRDGESLSFGIAGRAEPSAAEQPRGRLLQVSPGFFSVAGVPLIAGREFTAADRDDSPVVVVINDAMRQRYWPGTDPVGEFVVLGGDVSAEIVGLVEDIRQVSLAEAPEPTLYIPQAQNSRRGMAFVLRTAGDPSLLLPAIRGTIQDVDPDQPIEHIGTMRSVVASSTARPRFFSSLLLSFAALALLLAAFGIYGVVSNSVSRRISEIGIRVALGATRGELIGMILKQSMLPVFSGAIAGIVISLAATRVLSSILYGVSATDLTTFVSVPLLLMAVAAVACLFPARRAVRIDPTEALRTE